MKAKSNHPMILATRKDKSLVIDLLARSFDDNRSVNYIIPQDNRRLQRIRGLMDYSFEICCRYGKVYLSEDRKAVALVLLPDQQKTTPASLFLEAKLVVTAIGLSHLKKVLHREKRIKELRPKEPVYYLWFLGVAPADQGKGTGSRLLQSLIQEAESQNRVLCLETSTPQNVPWYRRAGFTLYNTLDLGYIIHFLRRPPSAWPGPAALCWGCKQSLE